MLTLLRLVLVAACLAVSAQPSASSNLTLVRSGVGVVGAPQQLSGVLDSNGNGRPELLVAGRWHVSLVEEDDGPRGYHEVARLDGPNGSSFRRAMLVDVPGEAQALLLRWSDRLELRDTATLSIKAILPGVYGGEIGNIALGDVDGDGLPEIVMPFNGSVLLLDPVTLASRGSVQLVVGGVEQIAVTNIVGDGSAEIIADNARAYTITRSGSTLSSTEVWNAGITETRVPYAVDFDGHAAIVLHSGYGAQLATFWPTPSIRTLVPADGSYLSLVFADVNGDGSVDLITADSMEVRAIDMASGSTLWERNTVYQEPYLGFVHSPVAIDLDGDGTMELAWANSSYNSGVVAMSLPLTGEPRWRSDFNQSFVTDWTLTTGAGSVPSIAYLTHWTHAYPRLSTLGFLDGLTFADVAGSAFSWLPGYDGLTGQVEQHAIASFSSDDLGNALVVAGAEYPSAGGDALSRWLWTFDGDGALLSSRTFTSSIDPQRIAVAQVLNRPERQVIVAGVTGTVSSTFARVEVIDYATGNVLWQSVALPTHDGALATKLEVADVDADGQLEIVFAYGENVTILKPSTSSDAIAGYAAQDFSLLDRGAGHNVKLATLNQQDVSVYDGLSGPPEKTVVLPEAAYGIALFAQAPEDILLFATSNYYGTTLRRLSDDRIMGFRADIPSGPLAVTNFDEDHRMEIIGKDLKIYRFDYYQIFRDGFDKYVQ